TCPRAPQVASKRSPGTGRLTSRAAGGLSANVSALPYMALLPAYLLGAEALRLMPEGRRGRTGEMTTAGRTGGTDAKAIARRSVPRGGAILLAALAAPTAVRAASSSLRVSSLRFGSLSWLLDTIRDQQIDAKLAIDIDLVDVATPQAGPI